MDLTAIELDAAKKSSPRWTLSGERRFESGESVFPKFWEIAGWPLYQNNWTLWQSPMSKNDPPASILLTGELANLSRKSCEVFDVSTPL
ncbi:hypothetical protein ACSFBX_28085 [Variovorax sp. RB2P76]|uniref:hypothetical protein n=1 Tax=unclassified Variovorax TaxID=663243 RepID=UPI003F467091